MSALVINGYEHVRGVLWDFAGVAQFLNETIHRTSEAPELPRFVVFAEPVNIAALDETTVINCESDCRFLYWRLTGEVTKKRIQRCLRPSS